MLKNRVGSSQAVQLLGLLTAIARGMHGFIPWLGNLRSCKLHSTAKNRVDLSPLRAETKCVQKHSVMDVNPHLLWLCSVKLPANIELAHTETLLQG